jgi:hypothetical protein
MSRVEASVFLCFSFSVVLVGFAAWDLFLALEKWDAKECALAREQYESMTCAGRATTLHVWPKGFLGLDQDGVLSCISHRFGMPSNQRSPIPHQATQILFSLKPNHDNCTCWRFSKSGSPDDGRCDVCVLEP